MRDADNRRVELCAALGIGLETGWSDAMVSMRKRLMPEGMEWPRYESGKQVRIGDAVRIDGFDGEYKVVGLDIDRGGRLRVKCEIPGGMTVSYFFPEQMARIASSEPKVLDADGEPLEVGQTVWSANGDELVVGAIEDGGHTVACRYANVRDGIPVHGMWSPSDLTHQRPVLDADGVPIHEGETLYGIGRTQHEFIVLGQPGLGGGRGRFKIACHDVTDGVDCHCDPSLLTHAKPEPPDSWERIEGDAGMQPYAYCVSRMLYGGEDEESTTPTTELFARDLVRRCKALAERGER